MKKIVFKFSSLVISLLVASSICFAGGNKYSRIRKHARKPEAHVEAAKIRKEVTPGTPINDVYVIHFIIDGINLETFNEMLSTGRLPTVGKHFVDSGAVFEKGLSDFPSTSSTVYQAYTTGLWPGHAGIPYLSRFDRQKWRIVDYLSIGDHNMLNTDLINIRALTNPDSGKIDPPTTIFEILEGHPTAAVYSSFYRGAKVVRPGSPLHALWSVYVTGNPLKVDVLAYRETIKLFEGTFHDIPRYTLAGLYSADVMGHKYGPHSDEVSEVLVQFDVFLKDFLEILEKRGIDDKTYIILSADHGMHKTKKLFRLNKLLEAKGIHVKPKNPRDNKYTLFTAVRGVTSAHIYVRHDNGFEPIENADILRNQKTRAGKRIDLIDTILDMDATEFLIVRDGPRRARVYSYDGKGAEIACFTMKFTDYCSYRFDELTGDPLGYSSIKSLNHLLDGRPHSTFAWREATAGETYPDAVINLSQIFRDGRAGDAFITARTDYSFRKAKKGNHGGIIDGDMRTPFLIAGPTVPEGTFGAARPVDIYPLLVEWFGLDVSERNHDGMNPFHKYKGENMDFVQLAALEQLFEENTQIQRRKDIPPHFYHLSKVARKEMERRRKVLLKLNSLMTALKGKKREDDHLAIVTRTANWARDSHHRMENILKVLTE